MATKLLQKQNMPAGVSLGCQMQTGTCRHTQVADRPFLQIADSRRRSFPRSLHRQRSRRLTCASMDEGQHSGAKLFGMDVKPLSPAASRVASVSRPSKDAESHTAFSRVLTTLKDHSAAFRQSAAALAVGMVLLAGPVSAADVAKVGTCLLANCQVALARCVGDGECLENLICLQLCNGRPDETECQIRCGDLYADKAVEAFTACAVSDKKCVPQRVDESSYPVPPDCALDQSFDINNFQGRWYITAGLNPLFDTFDCQVHYFGVPEPGKLYGKINWRIPKGNKDFIERSTVQTFDQKLDVSPAYLRNDNNEYLHYTDDWYILASKPDQYVVIYYKGNNDAWKGYGGATVYTRESTLPQEYIPEISAAVEKAGLKWSQFKVTDNSCPPHPPQESLVQELEEGLEKEVKEVEYALENDLTSFGKGFTVIEKGLLGELQKDEQGLVQELVREEKNAERTLDNARKFVERIERQYTLPGPLRWLYNLGFPMPNM